MASLDPYEEYMSGNHASPAVGIGLGAVTKALPVVGAVMQGAGLLSSLYGGYKSQQASEKNYELQKAEFERQRRMAANA